MKTTEDEGAEIDENGYKIVNANTTSMKSRRWLMGQPVSVGTDNDRVSLDEFFSAWGVRDVT